MGALIRHGWWRSTPAEVRSVWKVRLDSFDCIPLYRENTTCLGLQTDRLECGDDEFVFSGREPETLLLERFRVVVCVDERKEAERLLREWKDLVAPPGEAVHSDESDDFHPVRSTYKWNANAGTLTLGLEAKPEASIWIVKFYLARAPAKVAHR